MNFSETPDAALGRRLRKTYLIAFTAAIGGFLFGYDLSLIGAANIYLKEQFHLSEQALGFATASASLGCAFGPFIGAWLCDAIGRERTMIAACGLLAVGATLTAMAPSIAIFNTFRILGGIGVGLCSVASPMYIAEMAPAKMRGKLGLMYQLAIVVGSTAAPLIAYVLVRLLPDSTCWRWMFGSQTFVVLLFAAFLFRLPPSPRWLAEKGRMTESLAVLSAVHGPAEAAVELKEIQGALSEEQGGIAELFQPGIRYALLIGLLLAFFNNWTGWSMMGGYIPMLFQLSGLHERNAAILEFSFTYLAMAIWTVVSISVVDRAGRRPLWIWASVGMALVTAATGMVFQFHLHGAVVLLVITLCTIPHGLAIGPLPWLMMSEIFPTRIRAKAVAVTTTFLWITIYAGTQLFPTFIGWSQSLLGSAGGAFWIFTVVSVLSALFGFYMLIETKNRTLENIAHSWLEESTPPPEPASAPVPGIDT
jgi:sugar porter (SP) family MFS transporter